MMSAQGGPRLGHILIHNANGARMRPKEKEMHLAIFNNLGTNASDEAVMESATVVYRRADGDEYHPWPPHAQWACDVEVAARDFIERRTGKTAATLLAASSLFWSEEKSVATAHLVCIAAAHLASSEHPAGERMRRALYPVRRLGVEEIASTARCVWSEWAEDDLAEKSRRMREAAEARTIAYMLSRNERSTSPHPEPPYRKG